MDDRLQVSTITLDWNEIMVTSNTAVMVVRDRRMKLLEV